MPALETKNSPTITPTQDKPILIFIVLIKLGIDDGRITSSISETL